MGRFEKSGDSISYVPDEEEGSGYRSSREGREWVELADWLGIDPMQKNAMQEATYYACIRILRETVGKMPLMFMQTMQDGGIRTATENPLHTTLSRRPNPYVSATAFWSSIEQDRQHTGNAYVLKTGAGTDMKPFQLWRMPPGEVEVWWDDGLWLGAVPDIYYIWSTGGKRMVLKSCEVMHFRSSDTEDGIMGIPMVDRMRRLVDGALGAQDFQNRLITSGMTAKMVLQYTSNLEGDAVERFTKGIEMYAKGRLKGRGIENIIPIPIGSQITPLNVKLTDAQFMELKKYSAVQIAAAMGIKPQQIGDQTKQSYASSKAQQEMFYTDTMLYILRHFEDEITYKLLTPAMRAEGYFVEFDSEVLLRNDFKTQVEANKLAIESFQMTPNEGRKKLNLPAKPGGDILLGNGSTIPLTDVGIQYERDASGGGEQDGNEQQGEDEGRQGQEPGEQPGGDGAGE